MSGRQSAAQMPTTTNIVKSAGSRRARRSQNCRRSDATLPLVLLDQQRRDEEAGHDEEHLDTEEPALEPPSSSAWYSMTAITDTARRPSRPGMYPIVLAPARPGRARERGAAPRSSDGGSAVVDTGYSFAAAMQQGRDSAGLAGRLRPEVEVDRTRRLVTAGRPGERRRAARRGADEVGRGDADPIEQDAGDDRPDQPAQAAVAAGSRAPRPAGDRAPWSRRGCEVRHDEPLADGEQRERGDEHGPGVGGRQYEEPHGVQPESDAKRVGRPDAGGDRAHQPDLHDHARCGYRRNTAATPASVRSNRRSAKSENVASKPLKAAIATNPAMASDQTRAAAARRRGGRGPGLGACLR